MNRFVGALVLIIALAGAGLSQVRPQPQQRPPQRLRPGDVVPPPVVPPPSAGQRPRPNPAIQDAVLGFYISQFQQVAEVNDEVFAKILPFLREFVTDRFDISARHTRALNQIRQLIARGSPDDELRRMVRELDQSDADSQTNQQKFLDNVDPMLNPRQQAKVRIFQAMADQRIRQMLDRIQNAGPNQLQQAAPNARD